MATGAGYQSTEQLEAARRQVDEVQNIMKSNVEKVLERDGKLSSLENRAERLQVCNALKNLIRGPMLQIVHKLVDTDLMLIGHGALCRPKL